MHQASINGNALWGALPAIAGFLTERAGVPVVRGSHAATNGTAVFLPPLPDTALTWRDIIKTIAYLYHESAHILKTDFSLERKTPLEKAVANILEDIRIERHAIHTFPAAQRYLNELVQIFSEDGIAGVTPGFVPSSDSDTEAHILQWYMLYRLRHDVLKQTAIAPVLEITAKVAERKLPQGMRVRLNALMFQVIDCESTNDVLILTREIISMIEEEKQKEEEKARDKQEDSSQEQDKNQQQQDGDDQQQEPSDDGSSDETIGSDGDDDQSASTGQQHTGDSTEDSSGAHSEPGQGDPAGNASSLGNLLSMQDDDCIKDVGEMLSEAVQAVSANVGHTGISMPNIHPLKLKEADADIQGMRGSINAIRTKTLNWMHSAAQSEVAHSRHGVQIDSTRLYAVHCGGDIFAEECEGVDLNAAVAIVIDRSLSMSSRIASAVRAAVSTMLAFDVPGIKTQVSVFPVYGSVGNNQYDEGVAIVKRWDDSPRLLAGRIASLSVSGGTPMAQAILAASSDLLQRPETLRLVLVVTDGDPDNIQSTTEVIAKARSAGLAVAGVGIGSDVDTSAVFGDRHSSKIEDINSLSSTMIKLIRSSITRH